MSTILAGALVASAGISPAAASDTPDDPLSVLEGLSETAGSPEQDVLGDLAGEGSSDDSIAVAVTVEGTETTVPTVANEGITLAGELTLTIGVPFAADAEDAQLLADGVVAYDNGNGSTTVPLVKTDGSVQIATIIQSEEAPTRYVYALGLPDGVLAQLDESGQVVMLNDDGSFFAGITAAWATDADGAAVPTHYELSGSVLTQVVDHAEGYTYPIVADPWAGQNLLSSASVTQKIGYHIVNAVATAWGRTWNGLATHASHVAELKSRLGPNHSAKVDANGGTIREQFLCHVAGNFFEQGIYNMESNRPAVYWPNQLNPVVRCNP